ncbi:MAG: glycosyltransferase family 2 protein [Treponema sp.]|nr:glycosyltransferase family 2 protein [Treponema sp.]
MNKLISIIVPVYNRETLVQKTVESILAQTYTNFELILVDDGSKDNSLKVCQDLAKASKKIKVFSKPNGGVSSARNFGLEKASGDYICFVDSDDTITKDYLEVFANEVKSNDYDLVITGISHTTFDGKVLRECKSPDVINQIQDFWNSFGILQSHCFLWEPGNKFFKNSIIKKHSIRFDEKTQIAEDALFNADYLAGISSISVIPVCTYILRGHESDLGLSNSYHESFFYAHKKLFTKYVELLKNNNVFSVQNITLLSSIYCEILFSGLKKAYNSKGIIKAAQARQAVIPELLPAAKDKLYLYLKLLDGIQNSRIAVLKKILVFKYYSKMLLCSEQLNKSRSIKICTVKFCKLLVFFILFQIERIFKINKYISCKTE